MRSVIFAITISMVVAAVPVWGQTAGSEQPGTEASIAIRAMVGAAFADRHCAHYRLNNENMLAFLAAANVKPVELKERYHDYTVTFSLWMNKQFDGSPSEFCDFLAETYGPGGKIPDLIEKY